MFETKDLGSLNVVAQKSDGRILMLSIQIYLSLEARALGTVGNWADFRNSLLHSPVPEFAVGAANGLTL